MHIGNIVGRSQLISILKLNSDEVIDVVNLKLPVEMFGSFGASAAYHMNKLHWISVLLSNTPEDVVRFLVNVSFEAMRAKRKRKKAE